MATRLTPWTATMLDTVERAGDWIPIDEVIAAGAHAVPPGRAIQQRERQAARKRTTDTTNTVTDDERIRIGARDLARRALDGLARNGLIERDGHLIRRTP